MGRSKQEVTKVVFLCKNDRKVCRCIHIPKHNLQKMVKKHQATLFASDGKIQSSGDLTQTASLEFAQAQLLCLNMKAVIKFYRMPM